MNIGTGYKRRAEVEKSKKLTKISGDDDFFPPFESLKGRIQMDMDVNNTREDGKLITWTEKATLESS